MKTKSLLITIPRYSDVYYQKFDPINIDTGNDQVINNIVCSIDTTSLYNIGVPLITLFVPCQIVSMFVLLINYPIISLFLHVHFREISCY